VIQDPASLTQNLTGIRSAFEVADFEPFVGCSFRVKTDPAGWCPYELSLVSLHRHAEVKTTRKGVRRQPFSLFFEGPISPLLSQQLCVMEPCTDEHALRFLLLLKPIGVRAEERLADYEAVVA